MYIHSIAIQALVDRISNLAGGDQDWQDHEIWRSKHPQDFAAVNTVREASGDILSAAIELSEDGLLQYCPVRIYLRIVSASVFLLKSISLGSREADVSTSLKILERCISALQINRADDIHLSSRYATLISRHVQRFKRNFRVKKAVLPPNVSVHQSRAVSPSALNAHNSQAGLISIQPQQQQQHEATTYSSGTQPIPSNVDNTAAATLGQFDFTANVFMEDWLAQPFDPQIAPFGTNYMPGGAGIALDSLDFLWNISNQIQQ